MPLFSGVFYLEYDQNFRVKLGDNLACWDYGSGLVLDVGQFKRKYLVDETTPSFVPLPYFRNNYHFIDSDMITRNDKFVQDFSLLFPLSIDLHAVLLSRNGAYGFSSWRQLQYHSMDPRSKYIRDYGLMEWSPGITDKKQLEGPVFGTFVFTGGLLGKIDNSSKETMFDSIFEVDGSFTNESILFNADDIVLRDQNFEVIPTFWEAGLVGYKSPENGGGVGEKNLSASIQHSIVLRQANPEKIVLNQELMKKVRLGKEGGVLSVSYGETIYPDRFMMFRKLVVVRERYLTNVYENSFDKMRNYVFNVADSSLYMRRVGKTFESCLGQFFDLQSNQKSYGSLNRWALGTPYIGSEQRTDFMFANVAADDFSGFGELSLKKMFNSVADIPAYPCYRHFHYLFPNDTSVSFQSNFQYQYRVDKHFGTKPFYGSYASYLMDVKIKSQGFSMVPDRDGVVEGVFLPKYEGAFESDGCVKLKLFEKTNTNGMRVHKIEFDVMVMKKPWLKRGFFPADRIVQISSLLADEYSDALCKVEYSSSGIVLSKAKLDNNNYSNILQSFVDNVMAPGVFLNTIKSGVAVGFPVYMLKNFSDGRKFFDLKYYSATSSEKYNMLLNTIPDMYLPFESLFNLKSFIKPVREGLLQLTYEGGKEHIYSTPSVVPSTHTDSDELSTGHSFCLREDWIRGNDFEKANHNFFAEICNFYLEDSKTTYFESAKESDFLEATAGTVYYMDIVLKKRNVVLSEGMYSDDVDYRGLPYGPPINADKTLLKEIEPSYLSYAQLLQMGPAYAPYTPPYFYGDAVARISFDPMDVDSSLRLGEGRRFSLEEIMANAKMRLYTRSHIYGIKQEGNKKLLIPYYSEEEKDFDGLFNTFDWVGYYSNGQFPDIMENLETGKIPGPLFLCGNMGIDQSVNLFGKKEYIEEKRGLNEPSVLRREYSWCIETKFETPVLDFSGHDVTTKDGMPEVFEYKEKGGRARGLWYDYGVEPNKDSGLILELRESFSERYEENSLISGVNQEMFDRCFNAPNALHLKCLIADGFIIPNGGIEITLYLVSNYDTYATGVISRRCGPDGAWVELGVPDDNFYFVDSGWRNWKYIRRGVVYPIHLKIKAFVGCGRHSYDYKIVFTSGLVRSESYLFDSTEQYKCNIELLQGATNPFLLQDMVDNDLNLYEDLLNRYLNYNINGKKYGSLISLCKFRSGEKKIGRIKEKHTLRECLIVLPYVVRNGEKEYITISKNRINEQVESYQKNGYSYRTIFGDLIEKTSIVELYELMNRYWFPKELDFRHYDVEPRVMFAFEVEHKLSKQDLIDLWQNILPLSMRNLEILNIKKEYLLEEYEILEGKPLPQDAKYEVYAIPYRAKQDYYDVVPSYGGKSEEGEIVFNWPYSYVRLVEYAKIGVRFNYEL